MKKTKYYFLGSLLFLTYGCLPCFEYTKVGEPEYPDNEPIKEKRKYFTIVNHTDKTYKNNILTALCPQKKANTNIWQMSYNPNYNYIDKNQNRYKIVFNKIRMIGANKGVNKNEKNNILRINGAYCRNGSSYTYGKEKLFLLSLDGGERKVFFGAYNFDYNVIWRDDDRECKRYFVKYDIHPIWQEKKLTIEIYEDRIEFSDPKIKETKRLRVRYDEYADPNTLPFWWEDN